MPQQHSPANRPSDEQIQSALEVLRASGRFTVLRQHISPTYERPDQQAKRAGETFALLVDSEATDNKPESAGLIQLAAVKVGLTPVSSGKDGQGDFQVRFIDSLNMLHDPGIPSTAAAQAVHRIDPQKLVGQSLNHRVIKQFASDADLVVAHNASFDRRLIERYTDAFSYLPWTCSMHDISWAELGINSRSLEFLLFKAGYVHQAHDALQDCEALARVLSHRFNIDGEPTANIPPGWAWMTWAAQRNARRIAAINAPYAAKDALKERGYHWHDGGADKLPVKAWVSAPIDDVDVSSELRWLMDNAYGGRRDSQVIVMESSALHRYSAAENTLSWETKQQVRLGNVVER